MIPVHDQEPVEALRADGADEALGDRVRLRARTGVLMTRILSLAKTGLKSRVNLLSRSRTKNRNRIPKGFAPFGIQALEGNIFVTYAKQRRRRS